MGTIFYFIDEKSDLLRAASFKAHGPGTRELTEEPGVPDIHFVFVFLFISSH